jgi:hypothetical protein
MKSDTSARVILDAAKANIAKRDNCARHKFKPEEYAFGKNMECTACGCKVPLHYIHPYVQGYMAAGGDPNDIWQDWQNSPQKRAATGG